MRRFKGDLTLKRGAIFDMDGTLFDTERYFRKAWVETADYFGRERHDIIGIEMSGTNVNQVPEILHKYYPEIDARAYFDRVVETVQGWSKTELALMPGTREILEFFKENNVIMSVASSSFHAIIEKNLKTAGISEYFSVIVGGDEVSSGKPSPEIFLKAAEEMKLPPQDCYVFEDSFNGIIAGQASGCSTIMIPDQRQPTEEIKNLCSGVYKSFIEAIEEIRNDH